MKRLPVTFAVIIGSAAVIFVVVAAAPASGQPIRPSPNAPPPILPTVAYPTIQLSCTGQGIGAPRIAGQKGWPNAPIATTKTCLAQGNCVVQHASCWPYSCDSGAKTCKTGCSEDAECGAFALCSSGRCVPPQKTYCAGVYQVRLDGTSTIPAPYACNPDTGRPYESCTNQTQCESHFVCDSSSHCVTLSR